MPDLSWTDERVEELKKMWADGLSASQIAGELGGLTRNAVIGKVHRLGLSGRARKSSPRAPRALGAPRKKSRWGLKVFGPQTPPSAPTPESGPAKPHRERPPVLANDTHCTLMELNDTRCRFPLGDPAKPDFMFCGATPVEGLPYCAACCQIAYIAGTAMSKRKKPSWSYRTR